MSSYSIVVPVYKTEKYISECLDSICAQSKSNASIEAVIVNDGSPDGCGEIIEKYIREHKEISFKYIYQDNAGELAARNAGIRAAGGDYCIFLDSDDTLADDAVSIIEKALAEQEEKAGKRPDVLICNYRYIGGIEDGISAAPAFPEGTHFSKDDGQEGFLQLYEKLVTTHEINSMWMKAIKTELLKSRSEIADVHDYTHVKKGPDYIQMLAVYDKARSVYCVDKVIYNYRISDTQSASKKFRHEVFADYMAVCSAVGKYIEHWQLPEEIIQKYNTWFIRYVLRIIKGAFLTGITKAQKKALVSEIFNNDIVKEKVHTVNIAEYSRLDRAEIKMMRAANVNAAIRFNTMIFGNRLGRHLMQRRIKSAANASNGSVASNDSIARNVSSASIAPQPPASTNMKNAVISGLFWRFFERCGSQLIQFIVMIVLARWFLSQEDFGTISLITIFITFANIFVQSGFSTALVQKKEVSQREYSSIFYLSLAIAVFLYLVLFFLAIPISIYYDEPLLIPILRLLALSIIFGAGSAVQLAVLSRRMQFRAVFYRTLGATIASGCVGLTMAFCGCGVWALVFSQLTTSLVSSLILWLTVKWRPSLCFSFASIRQLFNFGYKLLASTLISTIYDNIYPLVIGKRFGAAANGLYSKGRNIPNLLVENINNSIATVIFPALSSVQDDRARIKALVRRFMVTSCFVVFPMMAGLFAISDPLIRLLLTDKWEGAIPFMRIMCVAFAFWPVHTANLQAINAIGRSDVMLKLTVIKEIIGTVLLIITAHFGVYIFVATNAFTALSDMLINITPNKKMLGYGPKQQIKDILPYLLLSTVMGMIVYSITFLGLGNLLTIIIQIALGFVIYTAAAYFFKLEALQYLIQTIKERKR